MDQQQIKDKKLELLGRMSRQMNGAVASSLRSHSPRKLLTYGVSVPTIKDIVAPEKGNMALANEMYRSNVREMKLSAIYIADGALLSGSDLELWADGFASHEVMLHASAFTLWRSSDSPKVATEWLNSEDQLRRDSAAIIIATMAKEAVGDDSYYSQTLPSLDTRVGSEQLIRALAAIGRRSSELKSAVQKRLEELPSAISGEVEWQLE